MIRLATPSDARAVAEIYGPIVRSTAISFETEVPSEAEMERRIVSTLSYAPWLIWEEDGDVAGYVYASRHRDRTAYQWSVDVTAYTHENHKRKGIGRALYWALFDLLRLQKFYRAHAGITLPNAASVGLHESLGFRFIGVYPAVGFKLGAWHDVGWWQLPLLEPIEAPSPPLTLPEAQALPEWQAACEALIGPRT
jgi:L-amino acid N-acyltransferase YncA